MYGGLPIVEHSGALFGYRTEILRFPEQRFTVLCLCNLSNADPARLSRQVADVYLKKDLLPYTDSSKPVPAPPGARYPTLRAATLAAYPGVYKSVELDATCKLSVDNGGLMLRIGWNLPMRLNPTVHDEFSAEGRITLVFRRDGNDRISGFDLFADRVRNISFDRLD